MELPHLGNNCSEPTCKRLDFLPVKCDGCSRVFCNDHYRYECHGCETAPKSVQVPACPACGVPVAPARRGEPPDVAVWAHLERACDKRSGGGGGQRREGGRCSVRGCKVRELVAVVCDACRKNHCLKHRHPQDHGCDRRRNNVTTEWDGDEDEALARAIALSLEHASGESDEMLARRLQAEEREQQQRRRSVSAAIPPPTRDKCRIS